MEGVTFDSLTTTVIVILALCGAINVIGSTIKLIRDHRKPKEDAMDEINERLANDNVRIKEHGKAINDLQGGQKCLCEGVQALLNHALHNGNSDEMQAACGNINTWLRNRN